MLTCMGLANILEPGAWQWHFVALTALMAAAMAGIVAALARHRVWGGLLATLAGVYILVTYACAYAAPDKTPGHVIPTRAALEIFIDRSFDAMSQLATSTRPGADPYTFLPLGLAGLGFLILWALFMAIVASQPAWIGVAALAAWVLFLTGVPDAGWGWAIATAVTYLLLWAVGTPQHPRRLSATGIATVGVLATVAGIVVSLLSPSLPGFGSKADSLNLWLAGPGPSTSIAMVGSIDVGQQLLNTSSKVVMVTRGDYTGALKVGSMYSFDGFRWRGLPLEVTAAYTMALPEGDTLWPMFSLGGQSQGTMDDAWGDSTSLTVEPAEQLTDSHSWLPIATGPRSVEVTAWPQGGRGYLSYSMLDDAVQLDTGAYPESYEMVTQTLDRWVLDSAPVMGVLPDVLTSDLSSLAHYDDLFALAQEITADAVTQDGKLNALVDYFHSDDFEYTLSPRWASNEDPVWDFLQAKQGYCIHYATAMYTLGTIIGLPMRVSVGYLPGRLAKDDVREVTGSNAHMWPEAYFDSIGWVPYEPTPSVGSAVTEGLPLPTQTPTPSQEPSEANPSQQPSSNPTTGPVIGPGQIDYTRLWWGLGIGAGSVALVGAGFVLGVWVYRRRYTPEKAWRSIRAKAGTLVTDAMTLRRGVREVKARVSPETRTRLDTLVTYIEKTRYSDEPGTSSRGRPWWALQRAVIAELTGKTAKG
jgi:transglutaminase-like putative cysteine protease